MVIFILLALINLESNGIKLMSGDNLLSQLPVKFYYDKMTETKNIIYLERKFQELDEFIENISEVA